LGAVTVFEALLYLASLSPPAGSRGPVPAYVESAILISLPSAPTQDEWTRCRSVVARRMVNAWSGSDYVLAGVVRYVLGCFSMFRANELMSVSGYTKSWAERYHCLVEYRLLVWDLLKGLELRISM
jgi:hypothetical protein